MSTETFPSHPAPAPMSQPASAGFADSMRRRSTEFKNALIAGGVGIAIAFMAAGFGLGYWAGDAGSSSSTPGVTQMGGQMGQMGGGQMGGPMGQMGQGQTGSGQTGSGQTGSGQVPGQIQQGQTQQGQTGSGQTGSGTASSATS